MGSTGAGTGSGGRTAPGTRMNVRYTAGSGTTSVYEQRRNGVYNVTNGGRGTRVKGVRDLEEIRRNARRSGNSARRQRGR